MNSQTDVRRVTLTTLRCRCNTISALAFWLSCLALSSLDFALVMWLWIAARISSSAPPLSLLLLLFSAISGAISLRISAVWPPLWGSLGFDGAAGSPGAFGDAKRSLVIVGG